MMRLGYCGIAIDVDGAPEVMERIRAEVGPFFTRPAPRDGAPDVSLCLFEGSPPDSLAALERGEARPVVVDCSLYKHLASKGRRWDAPGGHLIAIELTGTRVWFSQATPRIELYQPSRDRLLLDSVRLIKGLFTPLVERAGGVQLHASGVAAEDEGVLLLGDMWAGKTTLLLELLSEYRVDQVSCDTSVIRLDAAGRVEAHGWPSPFSVSHGTLADRPELADLFPEERRGVPYGELWREGKKSVFTSAQIVERFGAKLAPHPARLSACILIQYAPDAPTRLERMGSESELRDAMARVYLGSRDPIYPNWHQYVTADAALIEANVARVAKALWAQCDLFRLTWAPSAVSLLNRIERLGSRHRHLGSLLRWGAP